MSGPSSTHLELPARARLSYALFRFFVYGAILCVGELFFYNIVRLGRQIPGLHLLFQFSWQVDPRLPLDGVWYTPQRMLYGQCSLWMFLVYGLALLFLCEPLSTRLKNLHFLGRAAIYAGFVFLYEGLSGMLLRELLGYYVWYYDDPWAAFGGNTSALILPVWGIVGLLSERITRELTSPVVRGAFLARLSERPKAGPKAFELAEPLQRPKALKAPHPAA